jgi:hypothetical protein
MLESIPDKLERTLSLALAPNEKVFIKLRGAFKEALVCTSTRVIILKGGLMTGQVFGTDMFQCPYPNVAGAQVNFHLLRGYFELSAGGMRNTPKSFWNSDKSVNAAKAPNCVAIGGREQAAKFREACAFIMQQASGGVRASMHAGEDGLTTLERLAKLRDAGVISAAEYQAKKTEILSRL